MKIFGHDNEQTIVQLQHVREGAVGAALMADGHVMPRKRNPKTGQVISPGRVTPEMMQAWVREKGVTLRRGGLDENPHVYRRLPEVLAAQEGTVEVLHTLTPLVVVTAGADELDPYKD